MKTEFIDEGDLVFLGDEDNVIKIKLQTEIGMVLEYIASKQLVIDISSHLFKKVRLFGRCECRFEGDRAIDIRNATVERFEVLT